MNRFVNLQVQRSTDLHTYRSRYPDIQRSTDLHIYRSRYPEIQKIQRTRDPQIQRSTDDQWKKWNEKKQECKKCSIIVRRDENNLNVVIDDFINWFSDQLNAWNFAVFAVYVGVSCQLTSYQYILNTMFFCKNWQALNFLSNGIWYVYIFLEIISAN